MASKYIENQASDLQVEARRLEKVEAARGLCWTIPESELPPLDMIQTIGSHDVAHFRSVMAQMFHEIAYRCDVNETSSVLDLGCGCGRLAFPFAGLLTAGRYYGFDVWEAGISWCSNNIAQRHQNCEFHQVDAKNNYYFEDRKIGVDNELTLRPVADEAIDVVFAVSVFTHLLRRDCEAYLREVTRVLKKDGRAYITGFIVDRFFRRYVEATGNHKAVKVGDDGGAYAYAGQDFFAGYTPEAWREMFDSAGLEIVAFESGRWARKPGARPFQDTCVAVRRL